MLLSGVSYYVVPMFQLTPPIPRASRAGRRCPWWVCCSPGQCNWSLPVPTGGPWVWLAGLGVAAAYAAVTLWLQPRRRRRIADPTFHFFRGAMICLLAAFVSGLAMVLVPALGDEPRTAWWLGVLVIAGSSFRRSTACSTRSCPSSTGCTCNA